jgi:hypothetical protein
MHQEKIKHASHGQIQPSGHNESIKDVLVLPGYEPKDPISCYF